jgi:hypothetical protein
MKIITRGYQISLTLAILLISPWASAGQISQEVQDKAREIISNPQASTEEVLDAKFILRHNKTHHSAKKQKWPSKQVPAAKLDPQIVPKTKPSKPIQKSIPTNNPPVISNPQEKRAQELDNQPDTSITNWLKGLKKLYFSTNAMDDEDAGKDQGLHPSSPLDDEIPAINTLPPPSNLPKATLPISTPRAHQGVYQNVSALRVVEDLLPDDWIIRYEAVDEKLATTKINYYSEKTRMQSISEIIYGIGLKMKILNRLKLIIVTK